MPRAKLEPLDLGPQSECVNISSCLHAWLTSNLVYIELNGSGFIACKVCPLKAGALQMFHHCHVSGPWGHDNSKQHQWLVVVTKERASQSPFLPIATLLLIRLKDIYSALSRQLNLKMSLMPYMKQLEEELVEEDIELLQKKARESKDFSNSLEYLFKSHVPSSWPLSGF